MNLEVLIPFLLLPAALTKETPPPVAPALERLLARSTRRSMALPHEHAAIFERFGLGAPYPHAPLMVLADGLAVGDDGWMFAEPVHLDAGHNGIALFPSDYLAVQPAETTALIAALNEHFAADGIAFLAGADGRWYVRYPPSETPLTHSVEAARAGVLARLLPRSPGRLNWAALQNEAQMVLYRHHVNEARELDGKPTINGIWFWGGGEMPRGKPSGQPVDAVATDSVLVRQLAALAGTPVHAADPAALFAGRLGEANRVLLVLDVLERPALNLDVAAWSSRLQQLDAAWFQPIEAALADGRVSQVRIRAPAWEVERDFSLTRRQYLFGFWRRARSVMAHA